jgi:hypothetical protein
LFEPDEAQAHTGCAGHWIFIGSRSESDSKDSYSHDD